MRPFHDEDFPVIGEVLDVVKTARYQFGTIAHMGEDLEHSVAGLHLWLEKVQVFLSRPGNAARTAAAIVAAAAALNLARGWLSARRASSRLGSAPIIRQFFKLLTFVCMPAN